MDIDVVETFLERQRESWRSLLSDRTIDSRHLELALKTHYRRMRFIAILKFPDLPFSPLTPPRRSIKSEESSPFNVPRAVSAGTADSKLSPRTPSIRFTSSGGALSAVPGNSRLVGGLCTPYTPTRHNGPAAFIPRASTASNRVSPFSVGGDSSKSSDSDWGCLNDNIDSSSDSSVNSPLGKRPTLRRTLRDRKSRLLQINTIETPQTKERKPRLSLNFRSSPNNVQVKQSASKNERTLIVEDAMERALTDFEWNEHGTQETPTKKRKLAW